MPNRFKPNYKMDEERATGITIGNLMGNLKPGANVDTNGTAAIDNITKKGTKPTGGTGNGGSGGGSKEQTTTNTNTVAAPATQQLTYTPTAQRKPTDPYQPGENVTAAEQRLREEEANKPGSYTPSAEVLAAQEALAGIQANKPQNYTSKYGDQLDSILQQITNPEAFKWSFDGDELFKLYADQYTRRGKQAMQDAMGQAAGLTGGYGNSYASQVGQQTYDQYLNDLYDRGFELRDRAYQMWQDQQADKYNQYNLLANADQTDYGRYRDTVGDWENDRTYATDRYDNERNYDYNQYRDLVGDWQTNRNFAADRVDTERSYDYSKWQDERDFNEQQYQFDAEMDERVRQFNESLNWDRMSADQKYAAEYAMNILASGQMPSDAMLQAAGLSTDDANKLKAKISSGGGSVGGKTYYMDEYGNIYSTDKKGNKTYVDPSKLNDRDYIDTSAFQAAMGNQGAATGAAAGAAAAGTQGQQPANNVNNPVNKKKFYSK